MTDTAPRLDRRGRIAAADAERQRLWAHAAPESGPWHAGSSLTAGVLLYGGLGWLLDRWLGWGWLTPAGVVLGMTAAVVSLWFRYGVDRSHGDDHRMTSTDAGAAAPAGPGEHPRPTDRSAVEDAP